MMGGKTRKIKDSVKQDLIDLVKWYDEMSDQRPLTANEIKRVKELKESLDEYKYTGWGVGTFMDLCDKIISKQQVSDSRRVKDDADDADVESWKNEIRSILTESALFDVNYLKGESDKSKKIITNYIMEARTNLVIALQKCVNFQHNGGYLNN